MRPISFADENDCFPIELCNTHSLPDLQSWFQSLSLLLLEPSLRILLLGTELTVQYLWNASAVPEAFGAVVAFALKAPASAQSVSSIRLNSSFNIVPGVVSYH